MAKKNPALNAAPKKKGTVSTTKRTMNFVHHESSIHWGRLIPVLLVLIVAAAIFAKVGIMDQLDKKTAAYSELALQQEQLAAVNTKLAGYDELEKQYGRYSYGWMNETEVNMVGRIDVLNLVEKYIAPHAIIENLAVNNNVLTMNLHNITLAKASDMGKALEETDLVVSASINSAVAEEGEEASIFISIILEKPSQEKEAE